ncbi:DUF3108 domain-containing protein [Salidesulfovibrio brasiliensis]|uniref:DUF3108 domain-containing protein n=1 Tax=Salidesulfovibrio brasiliensis TaxID=221711 RepID=UPI000A5E03F5|nr:DUF3108 domain-containing protein [Salidesulfovibrio brasiliensis]
MYRMTLALLGLLLFSGTAMAGIKVPFGVGERFTYDLYWTVIKAGNATLEVLPGEPIDGHETVHLHAKARTTPFIDTFYKVRNTIDSWADPDMKRAYKYFKSQREGTYEKDALVVFDWDEMKSRRYIKGDLRHELDLDGPYFDPLSILFNFRKHILYKTMRFSGPVTDGKVLVPGEAYVAGKNVIDTPIGEIDCFRVELETKHLSGVFRKSSKAKLVVWFSADDRRIPVKVKSKVAVGSFSMELTGYRPPDKPVASLP